MARRNIGISGLQRRDDELASYSSLSSDLSAAQLDILSVQLTTFQTALRDFATKHRSTIASDPVFRAHFADMCTELNIDPLGGGRKGLWDFVGVSEWTYALAVQVVDVCLNHRDRLGGLVHVDTVLEGVAKLRGNNAVTRADLARAIKALEPLGAGYTLLAGGTLVRCVQAEMDTDALAVLEVAAGEERPIVDEPKLRLARPAWPTERVRSAIDKAVVEGFLWVDDQAEGGRREFWAPSLVDFA